MYIFTLYNYKNCLNSMDLFSIHSLKSESCVYSNPRSPGRAKRASSNVAKRMPGVEHIAGGTEFGEDTVSWKKSGYITS